ncbi:unnamed protein product [Rotaria socialis]|nr:unnamed protein product [Rotaria socialis]
MNYMQVAGRESIHVAINDAVLHALRTRSTSDSTVGIPEAPIIHIGIENAAYYGEYEGENDDAIIRTYL